MILLFDTENISISQSNYSLEVMNNSQKQMFNIKKIESIIVSAEISINTSALKLIFEYDIPVYYLDKFGAVVGICRKANFNNASEIRRKQVIFILKPEAVKWVKVIFGRKQDGQLQNLKYFLDRKAALKELYDQKIPLFESTASKIKLVKNSDLTEVRSHLLGIEGATARIYWELLAAALPAQYRFDNRSKHPAQDIFNASLNYLYGMLYTIVETAIFSVGLDPTLGIFHTDQYQKPTLAFDIIEPFRHMVDRFLVEFFWNNSIETDFFTITKNEVLLAKKGKSVLIPLFIKFMDERTTINDQICSRKTHISRLAGDLTLKLLNL